MIYFVTNNENYNKSIDKSLHNDISIINNEKEAFDLFLNLLGKQKVLALDIEATGLDAYFAKPILYGIGTKAIQFMMDWTVDIKPYIRYLKERDKIILGHNLKYDIKIVWTNTGILLRKVYDTMICEQRLFMRLGYSNALSALVERYLKKVMIKTTRNEFIDANLNTFKINASHLYYLKGDLADLFEIRKLQNGYLKHYNLAFSIYGVEFPLISIIAKAELEGFNLNAEKWKQRVLSDIQKQFEIEVELDKEVLRLRDYVSENKLFKGVDPKFTLTGGKYTHKREHNPLYDSFKSNKLTDIIDLFGEQMTHQTLTGLKKKVTKNPNNTSYNSKKEIVYIFARLGQPLITPEEQYEVPKLNSKSKLIDSINKFTIKEDFLLKYLLRYPDSIMADFIKMKIKHSKLEKGITTYGDNFIDKINPETGKLHTIFRQCDANTGRFQSGGGDKEPDKPNFQNIPADKAYRECFETDKDCNILTADYSGAELIVMASHAQDFRLIELSKIDMHSFMATKCWRNIYGYRANKLLQLFNKNPSTKTISLIGEYQSNVMFYRTFEVDKNNTPQLRTDFKPMTFGAIYGLYPKKAGATLKVIPEEGKVAIDTIKAELPRTFAMVEKASLDAETYGYVILNERTNNRIWFPTLMKLIRGEVSRQTHFKEISDETSAARNARIQGTQADFVKEASVVLDKELERADKKAQILSWVHDEFVFKIPKYLDGSSNEWKEYIDINPKFFLFSPTTGKNYNNLTDLCIDIMIVVANRYLNNVTIGVEYHLEPNWTK